MAAGLSIAIRRGARTAPVLTSLAEQTRQQVDRRRLVEAERAPTRREAQALTLNGRTDGTIAHAGQRQSYAFSLASDALLYFDALTYNNDFSWTLSGPRGTEGAARGFTNSDAAPGSPPVAPAGEFIAK